MGSATIRRLALVAALLLLTPVWCGPSVLAEAMTAPGAAVIELTQGPAGGPPAIRRVDAGGWWAARTRPEQTRKLVALGLLVLLSLIRLLLSDTVHVRPLAPSPLGRRRHVISLRAPPPACS